MTRATPFLLLLACALPAFPHDWLIVPGERVGPVTARASLADLRRDFGEAAVVQATIRIDKTKSATGVEIYRDKPGETLAVVWPREESGLWWPLLVIPCYGLASAECKWRTVEGVRVGLGVGDLERLNQKPFLLYPSEELETWTEPWWDEGKLAIQLGEDIELQFNDNTGYHFYNGAAYMPSDQLPVYEGSRRIDRMFVHLLSGRRPIPKNDWMIGGHFWSMLIAGEAEALRETLGPAQVHRVLAEAEEGLGNIPGVAIFRGQDDREVLLRRDGNVVCGGPGAYKTCRWRIAGGIPLSTTVGDMERHNGRPFVFNGFGFDLGGIVTSWEGGTIGKLKGRSRFVVGCEGNYPQRMVGEVELRSNDPEIRKLKCTVELLDF